MVVTLAAVWITAAFGVSKHALQVELPSEGIACFSNKDCLTSEACVKQRAEEPARCIFQGPFSEDQFKQELPLALQLKTSASLNVSTLVIHPSEGKSARLTLGEGVNKFDLTLNDQGTFSITKESLNVFAISKEGDINVHGLLHARGALRVDGKLWYMGNEQFFLVAREYFSKGAYGWSNAATSTCGASKTMLGGYGKFGPGEVSKTYRKLPGHHKLRVTCNWHFIDAWQGEIAYLKVDGVYTWTDSYDYTPSKAGINVCGSPAAEAKFASYVDIVIPHNASSATVTFGTTLEGSPFEKSWGVDDVALYLM